MNSQAPYREEVRTLLTDWRQRAILALVSYNRGASRCRTWYAIIGATSAALTAMVGTAVFVSLGHSVSRTPRLVVGVVTVVAAVLVAFLTFAGLPERIQAYERAARRFGVVRREIELALLSLHDRDPGPNDLN